MLEKVIDILDEIRPLMLHPSGVEVHAKDGHANYVTNIDVEVQAVLKERLPALIQGSVFFAEEQRNQKLDERPTWVVDPIDGTMNFFRGCRFSAVSIALLEEKTPVLACIFQPFSNEIFTAEKGAGAFLNEKPIHVTDIAMERALVAVGTSPYHPELAEKTMKLGHDFLRQAADIRRTGSAALDLAYLASGRLDVFFELNVSPWDVAAGSLLVEEAGGSFEMPLCNEGVQYEHDAAILVSNSSCKADAERIFLSEFN